MIEPDNTTRGRFLFPVALDLEGRRCVVVGGGTVGARKAASLADAGARVVFVSPVLCPQAAAMVARGAEYINALFDPVHLDGAFLVVAATDDYAVNVKVSQAAQERNLLCNVATPNGGGNISLMATVRRGDLLLSVTAGGAGPALAARLRDQMSDTYGAEWEQVVTLLGAMRWRAKREISDEASRAVALRHLAGKADRFAALYKSGDGETARQEALACLTL